jgi:hypothetical protein
VIALVALLLVPVVVAGGYIFTELYRLRRPEDERG